MAKLFMVNGKVLPLGIFVSANNLTIAPGKTTAWPAGLPWDDASLDTSFDVEIPAKHALDNDRVCKSGSFGLHT